MCTGFFLFSFPLGCVFGEGYVEYRTNSIANVYQHVPNSVNLRFLSQIIFKSNFKNCYQKFLSVRLFF